MEKMKFYMKKGETEEMTFQLEYSLLIHTAGEEKTYGVSIEKMDAFGNKEQDSAEGLFESREKADQLLEKLAEGVVFPVHLASICDDFISEEENKW